MHVATGREPIVRISRLTSKPMTYYPCYNLQTLGLAAPVPTDALITYINNDLTTQGKDAFVDEVKFFQEPFFLTCQTRTYIAGASPVDPGTAILIIGIVIAALLAYGIYVAQTTAKFVIETFYPQLKFHQVDSNGNYVTLNTLGEYISCQRAAHPEAFVCGRCGQVFTDTAHGGAFATLQEAFTAGQNHEANCPWTGGVPGQPEPWQGLIMLVLIGGVAIVGLWAVVKVLGRKHD